jgi:2-furoyl-CoA dehydrogenase 2Fe-2S iron sulfur subunit
MSSTTSIDKMSIQIQVNGVIQRRLVEPRTSLVDFLRDDLGLTGTHVGCEHGVCGSCTVQVNGVAQRSCLMLAVQADGAQLQTVEGLAQNDGVLSDLQEAFKRHHALQCGFCTSGILMSCVDWLERFKQLGKKPSERDVREMLSGHLCRCTGYTPIVQAVMEVANA